MCSGRPAEEIMARISRRLNWYVCTRALFAAFGGFAFGYDIGVINGVKDMPGFRETFGLNQGVNESEELCDDDVGSSAIIGLIVATLSVGCLAGALIAGTFSDFAGRKIAIIVGGVLYGVGGILQSAAYLLWMIFVGRFVGGLGVGVLFTVVPVYIAEISPKKLRGRLISFVSVELNAGLLAGFVANLVCIQFTFGWRISLSIQIAIGYILAFGMVFFPETPRWLVKKNKDRKAANVLAKIHQTSVEKVQVEIKDIQSNMVENDKEHLGHVLRLLSSQECVQRLFIGICLHIFSRAVGGSSVLYYSVSIFCKIGAPGYTASAVFGILTTLATLFAIFTIDKLGRKSLLLLGGLGMLTTMVISATLILVFRIEDGDSSAAEYIVVTLICLFMFAFTYGWGGVPWVINGEIHSLKVRGVAVSVTTSTYWIGNIISTLLTPVLLASPLQTFGTFYVLVGVHVAAILFVLLTIPETKGKSLERIELLFSKPWLERVNPTYYLRCACLWFFCKRNYSEEDTVGVVTEMDTNSNMAAEMTQSITMPCSSQEMEEKITDA